MANPNAFNPTSMPSVQQQLDAYRQMYAEEKRKVEEAVNPFEPKYEEENPVEQEQQLSMWLNPVSSDTSMPEVAVNSDGYNQFIDMFENDPTVIEHGEQMQEVLEQLRQAIQSGQISYDQALSTAMELMDKFVAPSIDKHHGTSFTSRNIINPNVKDVASAFGEEVEDVPDGTQ